MKKNDEKCKKIGKNTYFCAHLMEVVAQLVRALDCGSRGRGFEPRLPPRQERV